MGIHPSDVTAVVITKGDQPELTAEREAQFARLGMDYIIQKSPDIYTRYATADRHAQTTAVFFQDDDVALTDEAILALCDLYEPGILVSNMFDAWIESQGYFDLALVGLGGICDVGLWKEPFERWLAAYGGPTYANEERILWDADFIFGVLAKWRRFDLDAESAIIMDVATDETRLSMKPGQHERKFETIDMARKLRTVVLTMMTQDEEENILRALRSNVEWWDTLLLLDTGSTDRTVELAQQFCREHGKGISLMRAEFTNFADMRTLLLKMGRLNGDYMLLMDADEEWQNTPERPLLWAEAYMLHYEGSVDWAQPRLIASRFPWKWSGPVHSYLDWDEEREVLSVNMPLPLITHHGDTRHGTTKAERDVEILLAEIERTEDDLHRNLFMLGKAYDGLDMPDKAIEFYERRIALGSLDEEDYWCRLRLGNLLAEHRNEFALAVETLWDAYTIRPQRAEALRALAFYCTAVADATPYPEDDIVMVLRDQYRVT